MKKFLAFLVKYERLILLLIVVASAITKLLWLSYPNEYKFDEVYHVPTVHKIILNDGSAYEWWHGELEDELTSGAYIDWLHPPLAKYLSALSVIAFGDHSFAWRLPSALAGVAVTWLVFCLAKNLWPKNPLIPLLSALLITTEGLTFAQSQIVMNDIVLLVWILAALIFWWKWQKKKTWRNLLLVTLFTGLAVGTKWSGLGLFLIYGWQVLLNFREQTWKKIWSLLVVLVGTGLVYLAVYIPLFATGHDWAHFVELHNQIWLYQTSLEAAHPYSSPAYLWPIGQKAVYLYLDATTGKKVWGTPSYPTFYLGLVGMILSVVLLLRNKDKKNPDRKSLVFLLIVFFSLWAPWLFSPRIMFLHHFLPAVPVVCIMAAFLLDWCTTHYWLKDKK